MSNAFNSWIWWAEAKTDASHGGRLVNARVCVHLCDGAWEGRTRELNDCFI